MIFHDKHYWALILGGSSGIGRATAHKLAREGMNICIIYRERRQKMEEVKQAFEEMRAQGVQVLDINLDAVRLDKMEEALALIKSEFGPNDKVRLLLHSISRGNLKLMADIPKDPSSEGLSEEFAHIQLASLKNLEGTGILSRNDFQSTLDYMALSLYDWVRALHEAKLFATDARVLSLTSEGSQKAWRNYAAVSAAKAALEAICRSIALEFAPYGIRCNIVQPGITDTASLRAIPGAEQLKQNALLRNPFSRLTKPEDIANAIYLLCRDEAAWINGAFIPVDGGERNGG